MADMHEPGITAADEAEVERGRLARMIESRRHPSMCIRHKRRLAWMPAPAWWIHDDNLTGPAHTCTAMWDKRAPDGIGAGPTDFADISIKGRA